MNKGYRHRYNLIEYLIIYSLSYRAMGRLMLNVFTKDLDRHFVERIMLAVTEVNGCEVCSYAHATMALRQGMDKEEIEAFLKGDSTFIKTEEALAIYFAQHYADNNGYPEKITYENVLKEYGKKKTKVIIASIQMMMLGNVSGLPFSALISRIKKHPYHNSSFLYEIIMNLAMIFLFPFSVIFAIIFIFLYPKNIIFNKYKK